MVLWESPRQCSSWTLCEGFCWLLLLPVMLLIVARPVKLAAFPTSLSDCQTPTGWNCSGYDDRENDLSVMTSKELEDFIRENRIELIGYESL